MTETTEAPKTKRDIVIDTIKKGGATMDSLMKEADCKYPSVMSIFSTLRLMGMHPVKDVPVKDKDGNEVLTYRLVDQAEADKIKAEKASKAKANQGPAKSPAERLALAEKRVERCTNLLKTAAARAKKEPDNVEFDLRGQKADIELKLAQLELKKCKALVGKQPKQEKKAS